MAGRRREPEDRGTNLKRLRGECGFTQKELPDPAGFNHNVGMLERQQNAVNNLQTLPRL
jgi:hypothetical protein